MLSKQHSKKYGFIKIGVQIVAAFVAGALILGTQELAHYVSHNPKDDAYMPLADFVKYFGKDVTKNTESNGLGYLSNMSAFTIDDRPGIVATQSLTGKHLLAFMGEFFGAFILM